MINQTRLAYYAAHEFHHYGTPCAESLELMMILGGIVVQADGDAEVPDGHYRSGDPPERNKFLKHRITELIEQMDTIKSRLEALSENLGKPPTHKPDGVIEELKNTYMEALK